MTYAMRATKPEQLNSQLRALIRPLRGYNPHSALRPTAASS